MTYASSHVTVKAPFGTNAKAGPFTFRVEADAPNHFSGALQLNPLDGMVEKDGRKFKYTAQLKIKVDVTWHPSPKYAPEAVKVKAPEPSKGIADIQKGSGVNWGKVAQNVGDFAVKLVITVLGTLALQARMASLSPTNVTTTPFLHHIDLNHRYNRSNHSGMI